MNIRDFFADNGPLSKDGGPFRFRREQLEYALSVEDVIKQSGVSMIEGGTGVGKTLGYLYPHIQQSLETGERILIATKTRNLQDQIFEKDLPRLAKSMTFKFSVLKGRENYVCKGRLREAAEDMELFPFDPEARSYKYLKYFNELHPTGDLEGAQKFLHRYNPASARAINNVRATDDTCTSEHRYLCRYHAALADAHKSNIIVANHHLALLWPEHFPEVTRIVIDEAHVLEESASDVYGAAFTSAFLQMRLRRLYTRNRGKRTLLGRIDARDAAEFEISHIEELAVRLRRGISEFDAASEDFMQTRASERERIHDHELSKHEWQQLCDVAFMLSSSIGRLVKEMFRASKNLEEIERMKSHSERIHRSAEGFVEIQDCIESVFQVAPVDETILWFEQRQTRSTRGAPISIYRRTAIDIGTTIRTNLYDRFESVVLTSATMQASGSFDFLNRRLGIYQVPLPLLEPTQDSPNTNSVPKESEQKPIPMSRALEPVSVGHPFDYKSNVRFCMLAAEPPQQSSDIASWISKLAQLSNGRMLALFTNKKRMNETAELIDVPGMQVLLQNRDGGRHDLIEKFKNKSSAVLLGTKSFWEGIDIPGDSLSIVLMEKVPFTSPGDPVYEARCEALGKKWFMDYALPLAMLTLRQGFGRLIRSETDRGVVILLDPGKKSYLGKIKSTLPDCEIIHGDQNEILSSVGSFFTPNQ